MTTLYSQLKETSGFVSDMLYALQSLEGNDELTAEEKLRVSAASQYAAVLSDAISVFPETLQVRLNEKVYRTTLQDIYDFAHKERIPLYMVPILIDLVQYVNGGLELRVINFSRSLEIIRLNTVRFRASAFEADVTDIAELEVTLQNEFPNLPVVFTSLLAKLSVNPYPAVYDNLCEQVKALLAGN